MNLQECLDRLARGKISNLALCENGKVKEKFLPKVVDAINEAITRLYSVFPVKEKAVLVELYEGRTEYPLTSEHSWRHAQGKIDDEYNYYIIDTPENPFIDDIQNIVEIHDDLNRRRPINDPDSPLGIMVPEPNLIIVQVALDHRVLQVSYRAKHLILSPDDLTSTIQLPEHLFGALFSYTAYLLHSDMNTQEAVANAQKYYAEYQSIITEIQLNTPFTPDKLVSDKKFIRRGWV